MELFGLDAFKLFKDRRMALFFIFSALLGMSLQVTNSFAGPFISSFQGSSDPVIASSFAASNATLLTSISQVSEAFCILLIPFFLKRYGIKAVMLIAMFAWVLRFGFFGVGNPTMPGVLFFILSCIVYGVAFDFFNVSGGIFVDKECDTSVKASAQGLFMLMTNGIGATVGTLSAGAITSISLYVTNQDLITTLLVLFIVLFVFYFIGVLAMKIIMDFMKKKEKVEEEPVSDEGQVLEKDTNE